MVGNAYIHIPFCKTKCKYCSFVSFTDKEYRIKNYLKALIREINRYYRGENLKTIYFGGGTPSILDIDTIGQILQKFIFIPDFCEITFEVNPDDAELWYLRELRNLGINRLSIGAQTFDDDILSLIGRRHNSKQTLKVVENAKKAGFRNISLDLIYGLPNQNKNTLQKDLEVIKSLDIQHISTYGLKIEEPSNFYYFRPNNLPDDDIQADMYLMINEFLKNCGYNRYEISNFSKPKFESKHNLNYWGNFEYYGFGAGAHGYLCGVRYSNRADLEDYILNAVKRSTEHLVTTKEKFEEEIFLGLRREVGIDTSKIKKKYGIDFDLKYKNVLEKFYPEYLEKTPCGYKFTTKGILLSNNILAEFIE